MKYDAVIIGAGMSGLSAGIRLAYFDKRVLILERHYAYGGLNSYYTLGGRQYDVGLHALTNYTPPGHRGGQPLNRILRQLRLSREELKLHPQKYSEVRFPGRTLRFTNDVADFIESVATAFPKEAGGFYKVVEDVLSREYVLDGEDGESSARAYLRSFLNDEILIDMILCPVMYYGSPTPHDMPLGQFVVMFRSVYCEGFARPEGGVRTIIKVLVKKYRSLGGKLRMRCGVERIHHDGHRVTSIELDDGEHVEADLVLSSAGFDETMALCAGEANSTGTVAGVSTEDRLSFLESVSIVNVEPSAFGIMPTIVFYNTEDRFTYARPDGAYDLSSGVLCMPGNFTGAALPEGIVRVTNLANYDRWRTMSPAEYAVRKNEWADKASEIVAGMFPDFRPHVIERDVFSPTTIERYTGHLGGAVYGSPRKIHSGRTPLANLAICGTDQGFLGIVGAMLSGILIANAYGME